MEEVAEYKSEYDNGEIFAMAGATANHNRIAFDCGRLVGNALRGSGCEAFSADMKVRIAKDDIYYYPELSIACGKADFEDKKETILKNPTLIIEVLSEGTSSFDRGRKFHKYQQIASLQEYVLIEQIEPQIDSYFKMEDGSWNLRSHFGLEAVLELRSLGIKLKLADIYERVNFLAVEE